MKLILTSLILSSLSLAYSMNNKSEVMLIQTISESTDYVTDRPIIVNLFKFGWKSEMVEKGCDIKSKVFNKNGSINTLLSTKVTVHFEGLLNNEVFATIQGYDSNELPGQAAVIKTETTNNLYVSLNRNLEEGTKMLDFSFTILSKELTKTILANPDSLVAIDLAGGSLQDGLKVVKKKKLNNGQRQEITAECTYSI